MLEVLGDQYFTINKFNYLCNCRPLPNLYLYAELSVAVTVAHGDTNNATRVIFLAFLRAVPSYILASLKSQPN